MLQHDMLLCLMICVIGIVDASLLRSCCDFVLLGIDDDGLYMIDVVFIIFYPTSSSDTSCGSSKPSRRGGMAKAFYIVDAHHCYYE